MAISIHPAVDQGIKPAAEELRRRYAILPLL